MIFQTVLVIILSGVLYLIVIGISGLKFSKTKVNKLFCLTIFNDNQFELEARLKNLTAS